MKPSEVDGLIDEVRDLLKGIDEKGICSTDAWWETSDGAKFGAERLAALETLLRERLKP